MLFIITQAFEVCKAFVPFRQSSLLIHLGIDVRPAFCDILHGIHYIINIILSRYECFISGRTFSYSHLITPCFCQVSNIMGATQD